MTNKYEEDEERAEFQREKYFLGIKIHKQKQIKNKNGAIK